MGYYAFLDWQRVARKTAGAMQLIREDTYLHTGIFIHDFSGFLQFRGKDADTAYFALICNEADDA